MYYRFFFFRSTFFLYFAFGYPFTHLSKISGYFYGNQSTHLLQTSCCLSALLISRSHIYSLRLVVPITSFAWSSLNFLPIWIQLSLKQSDKKIVSPMLIQTDIGVFLVQLCIMIYDYLLIYYYILRYTNLDLQIIPKSFHNVDSLLIWPLHSYISKWSRNCLLFRSTWVHHGF